MLVYAEDLRATYPTDVDTMPIGVPMDNGLGGVPWLTLALSTMDEQERMIALDPTKFLEECLQHYDQTVHSYSCTFFKHELRIRGRPVTRAQEKIVVCFRQEPFSVYFKWKTSAFPS